MPPRPSHPRRRSLAALLTVAVLAGGATAASTAVAQTTGTTPVITTAPAPPAPPSPGTTPTTTTTTTTTPATEPKLKLSWTVLTRRCRAAANTVKTKKRTRKCSERARRVRGRVLRLRWRQHGEVHGRLTLAGQPVPNAVVYIETAIHAWSKTTTSVITDAQGDFSAPITGPSKTIEVIYSPGPGTYAEAKKTLKATAHLSLKVGHLTAGKTAHFSGIVFGGHIPQDLYIQFWYYAGPAGWQPFARLAIVKRHNGHWSAHVPIPADSRGYRYKIKATVVASPYWPWAHTASSVVTRVVS